MSKNDAESAYPSGYDMRPNSAALGLDADTKENDTSMLFEDGRPEPARKAPRRSVRAVWTAGTFVALASCYLIVSWLRGATDDKASPCAGAPVAYVESLTLPPGVSPQYQVTFDACGVSSFHPENAPCTPEASGPRSRCPSACAAPAPQPAAAMRVRKALHTLSDEEWQRVVAAMCGQHVRSACLATRSTPTPIHRGSVAAL